MTQTAVPTIRDTIAGVLNANGYSSYAQMPVIDQIVAALADREQQVYGDQAVTAQPVTDAILRALNENAVGQEAGTEAASLSKSERIERLETEVANLVSFARDNGYRL